MRMLAKVISAVAVASAAVTLSAGVAAADPPSGTVPKLTDVVGVGSNTTESMLDQLSLNYNGAHKTGARIYSFDALANAAATTSANVTLKAGCKALPRPNGSSAGITDLSTTQSVSGHNCINFARSSRAPKSTDPTNVTFVPLALDNVTYASITKGSNAPTNLTTAQLHSIYTCSATKWTQVGGKSSATIHPLLPQANSGTLAFFESAIGIATSGPGKCVSEPATLEENEGVDPIYTGANAANEIVPFSAGKWDAQAFHSAACKFTTCGTDKSGVNINCKTPTKTQNKFGCDVNGVLKLNDINGTAPTTGKGTSTVLNPKFTKIFVRTLYDVVKATKSIPSTLTPFFGPKGFFCSKTEDSVITNYGFEHDSDCGGIVAG
jgi:ABC-type phosphate transport system substrate-binding protein